MKKRTRSEVSLRPATLRDKAALLKWRNDPDTRRQSRSTVVVRMASHALWLSRTLKNPETRLYVAIDVNGTEVGTGRIDYRGQGTAEINLTVAPEHRGRGLAASIIDALGEEAAGLGWPHLVARVKAVNVRSVRAFTRVGFITDGCIHFERKR